MSVIERNIIRCLSTGGAVNLAIGAEGTFVVSVKTRDKSGWHISHGDTPFEALGVAAAAIRDDELVPFNILEAAAERRSRVIEGQARIKSLTDDDARTAVEASNAIFEDLLG